MLLRRDTSGRMWRLNSAAGGAAQESLSVHGRQGVGTEGRQAGAKDLYRSDELFLPSGQKQCGSGYGTRFLGGESAEISGIDYQHHA